MWYLYSFTVGVCILYYSGVFVSKLLQAIEICSRYRRTCVQGGNPRTSHGYAHRLLRLTQPVALIVLANRIRSCQVWGQRIWTASPLYNSNRRVRHSLIHCTPVCVWWFSSRKNYKHTHSLHPHLWHNEGRDVDTLIWKPSLSRNIADVGDRDITISVTI